MSWLLSPALGVIASSIDAQSSTDGWVLTSDGAGNTAWEAIPAGGGEVNDLSASVTWTNIPIANVPTGTSSSTVSLGNHTHDSIVDTNLVDKSATEAITGAWALSTSLNAVPLSRSISASTTTAATDYGIIIALTGGSAQELTLDSDPPTNSYVLVDNRSGNAWTIATATASNLIWAKDATTGDRTLADDGIAVCIHRGSGVWIINGSALLT